MNRCAKIVKTGNKCEEKLGKSAKKRIIIIGEKCAKEETKGLQAAECEKQSFQTTMIISSLII